MHLSGDTVQAEPRLGYTIFPPPQGNRAQDLRPRAALARALQNPDTRTPYNILHQLRIVLPATECA